MGRTVLFCVSERWQEGSQGARWEKKEKGERKRTSGGGGGAAQ